MSRGKPRSGLSFEDRIANAIVEWTVTVGVDRNGYATFDVDALTRAIMALVKKRDEHVKTFVRKQEARKRRGKPTRGEGS